MSLNVLPRTMPTVQRLARPASALHVRPRPSVRTFFSLPDIPSMLGSATGGNGSTKSGGGPDGDEHSYREEKVLPYTPRELYSVVANVPSYAAFVPFCTGSEIVSATGGGPPKISATEPFDVDAELRIGFMNFSEGYVSKVKARPYDSVEAVASSTPLFKTLVTTWTFRPPVPVNPSSQEINSADTGPTLVTLDLRWSFANPNHSLASGMFFGGFSGLMVKAFEKRCLYLYGPRS